MKEGHLKKKSFSFNFILRDSGNCLNCNCHISCSLAVQIADEHISMTHLKGVCCISWLRKVPETAD